MLAFAFAFSSPVSGARLLPVAQRGFASQPPESLLCLSARRRADELFFANPNPTTTALGHLIRPFAALKPLATIAPSMNVPTLPKCHLAMGTTPLRSPHPVPQYNLIMTIGAEIELAPGVRVPVAAVSYSFISSSGPGGQNVNKRATKCVLRVALSALPLTDAQVARLRDIAGHLITDSGDVLIAAGEHRSQGQNEEECRERLREILIIARRPVRKRVKTKPTRGSKERRISEKKRRGEIKKGRRNED